MMNLCHFAFMQMMIIAVAGRRALTHLETLTLQIDVEGLPKTIELTRQNRALATKFLPVWMTTGDRKNEYKKLNIMGKVGKTTPYHDICTKAAVIYFHNRGTIDGIIDVRYYIKGFPIDERNAVQILDRKYLHDTNNDERIDPREIRSVDNVTLLRTSRSERETFYPEMLVLISHDTYKSIEETSTFQRGVATVSHVLTTYNAVDMLYSTLRLSNIQINIAAIVIEGEPNYWGLVEETDSAEPHIKLQTVHHKINKYIWFRQNYFPQHSFDYMIYHTRYPLMDETNQTRMGVAYTRPITDYMFPPDYHKERADAVFKDYATYDHFITMAHELAHLFNADHDGEGEYQFLFDTSCGFSLMSEYGCHETCLKWSRQTEKELVDYLRTVSSCNLLNYPRSLDAARPKLVFSVKEQCRCYGYKSITESKEEIPKHGCLRPLICLNSTGHEDVVPLPIDGTPCGLRKVCWNKKCVKYKN